MPENIRKKLCKDTYIFCNSNSSYRGPLKSCHSISTKIILFLGEVRHEYRIEGSACKDCLISYCCTACTNCQLAAEVKYHDGLPSPMEHNCL